MIILIMLKFSKIFDKELVTTFPRMISLSEEATITLLFQESIALFVQG